MKAPFASFHSHTAAILTVGLALSSLPAGAADEEWTPVLVEGVLSPEAGQTRPPPGTEWHMDGNNVVTSDQSSEEGGFIYLSHPVIVPDGKKLVLEARAKIVSGMNGLTIGSQAALAGLRFFPESIEWRDGKKKINRDTSDEFHTYRIELTPDHMRVEMDGDLIIEGTPPPKKEDANTSRISFGSGNSSGQGEAIWESIRFKVE